MTKKLLRTKYIKLREELSQSQIEDRSIEIANNCLKLPIWHLDYFHLFLSISGKKEVDTQFLLHILQGKDKHIILPKSDFENYTLENYLLTDATIIKLNKWNIPEPVEGFVVPPSSIQVVFIPLLAYDHTGNRVGYGKGFYDKFLSACNHNTLKIGLSFFTPEERIDDIYEGDIKLDYCITPSKIFKF